MKPAVWFLVGLAALSAGLLLRAVLVAWALYADAVDRRRLALHARRVSIEQDSRDGEPLPSAGSADTGVRQRMLAGRIDAAQPIPGGWRW